ncbi:hypothetical protein CAPTEDRAFT_211284 [Capitella teleta]|uniref:SWIM-type domain-containing protein n=1 Tax=Capitella teleta TaxID=283909 RepID=R7TIC2_CAPTE|nr:hypothetical protein CAPTEDRAFT_211284 [Capitella teleta]|eukprot:ELT93593.1 hypothetical protein CAPTEDRAFT_211284 [Capitella teleta]
MVMSTIARECMASARRSSFVSQYVGTLPDKDRLLYLEKLVLTSGEEIPDPYSISEADWIVDIREWPIISWPDIHGYLIDTPSLYTKEKLRAYKSLDAVNYVLCGHVQEIKYHGISPESDFCLLRSLVLPSQRQGSSSTLYDAWVCISKSQGFILTANCTCIAGLASCCSHAAAILFKLEMAARTGLITEEVACTSVQCSWKELSRKKVVPKKLKHINFSRPKKSHIRTPMKRQKAREHVGNISSTDIAALQTAAPTAAFFSSISIDQDSDTDTASEGESDVPSPLSTLYDPSAKDLSPEDLSARCAVKWGREKEKTARLQYEQQMQVLHQDFHLRQTGLLVKEDEPFLAASPDGVFECECCGQGTLEIKCPYKYRFYNL